MKIKTYSKALLALALAVTVTACDENAWNDHLDGFEENNDAPMSNVETVEYTLTDAEYGTIAGLAANKALAGEEGADALAAVGKLKRFSEAAPASQYVPAFLNSTSFPYYISLTEGSAVKLTYNMAENEPAAYTEAQNPQKFTVSPEMYAEDVWGSENYVDAFCPSMPAADYLPSLLDDYVNPANGKYCIVSYNLATQEPVFGGGSDVPEAQTYNMLPETLEAMPEDWTIENVNLAEGLTFVWSWKIYNGAGYLNGSAYAGGAKASEAYAISPVLDLAGSDDWSLSFDHAAKFQTTLQTLCGVAVREEGATAWTMLDIPVWPTAGAWDFANSGDIDLSAFAGKKVQVAFKYGSTDEGSDTWEIKNLVVKPKAARNAASRAAAYVPTVVKNVAYVHDGTKWSEASGFVTLSPADYTAMGQKKANLSKAEPYLSTYLNANYPYAAEGDVKYVFWAHYANNATTNECAAYIFNGTAWTPNTFTTVQTSQFVLNGGKWIFDPNVTITLPAGRGQELSTLYFQACVDWVFNNICKPLGDTDIKSGKFYVTSYGNNEYYSGTSAYQGNLDLRPEKAREQYAAGYEGMTDDQIVALEKKRFMEEVMPGALSTLHPDAKPLAGLEVLYTINFAVYTGSTSTYTAVFKVVGPGKFEPVSCTWDE